jgi:MFS family permease
VRLWSFEVEDPRVSSALTPSEVRAYRANIWKFYIQTFLLNFQLWYPIWIIYLQEERGLTLGQVTLVEVPHLLTIVVLQIPAAAIADRWGRRTTLALGALLSAMGVTLFGLADTYQLILLSYVIWGASYALMSGADSAFLYDSLKALGREEDYQRIYGGAWAVLSAASLAGTLIGAPVAAATSLPFPIVLSGGIAALGFLAALTFTEPRHFRDGEPQLAYRQVMRESVRLALHQPTVRYAILFFGVLTIGGIAPMFFFQPFLVRHDIDLSQVGFWQTPTRIMGVVGALIAYRVVSRMGERRMFFLLPLAMAGSYVLLAAWDSVYAQVVFPVMNLAAVMSRPVVTDYLNRRVPTNQRATIISLTNLTYCLILIPLAPIVGLIADKLGLAAAFWTGTVITLAGMIILPLWWRAMAKEELPAQEAVPAA